MPRERAVDRDRGLPSNQVHAIDHDEQNRLWLAGPAGLARFDGSRVTAFDRRHGLSCVGLRAVAVGPLDTVWAGTDLGLEAVTLDGVPITWKSRGVWPYGLVERVEPYVGGAWIGTARGLVQLQDDRARGVLSVSFHEDLGFVRDLVRLDAERVVAISARLGLVEFDGRNTRRLRNLDLPEASGLSCVRLTAAGDLLVGSVAGVWILDVSGTTIGHLVPDQGACDVTALAVHGERWLVGSGRIVDEYAAGTSPRHLVRSEFASRVNDLLVDRFDNVWVATDSSGADRVSCFREALVRIETTVRGAVYSIKPEAAQELRVGGEGFDARLATRASGVPATLLSTLPTTIWDSTPDPSGGGSWLATQDGLLRVDASGAAARFGANEPVLSAPCRTVRWHGDDLLVGTLRGLARVKGDTVEEILAADGKGFGYVYVVSVDVKGRLWVGTLGRGLWRERDSLFEQVEHELLAATGNTYVVAESPTGQQVLVLQDERVVLISAQGGPRLLSIEHPVAGWTAVWLDDATIAIGSTDGLRIMDARSGAVERRVNAILGAGDWEFTNNRSLVAGPEGRLYCGLNAGLYVVDLGRIRRFPAPPAPSLGGVFWRGVSPDVVPGGFVVRPGKWSLQVTAFSAWLVDEEQVQFRFRLVGFDEEWSLLGPRAEARFSSLPPGRYVLEAQAYAPLTGFSEPATLLHLEVATRWWNRGAATLLRAFSTAYEKTVGASLRNRSLLEERGRLDALIAERTRALERANADLTTLSETLARTALTDALTGLANRRHFDATLAKEIERATRTGRPLAVLMIDVDHFKLYNDHYGHQAGDECLRAVARAVEGGVREYDVAARYGGEEFSVILPGATPREATVVGGRICLAVESLAREHAAAPRRIVTVSVGGASSQDQRAPLVASALLRAADRALYQAKEEGRNRFVFAVSSPPAP